jgi:hypothetical protein
VLLGAIVVILLSLIAIVYAPGLLPPYVGGLVFGIGSGAAMIPYTVMSEVNPASVKGSAAGAANFLVFSFSAFLAPGFGLILQHLSGGQTMTLETFQAADLVWVGAIVLALILTLFLRETGTGAQAGQR